MTTIARQTGPAPQPFEFEYSLTNQCLESNKVAFSQSGTKFGYIVMQHSIFPDGRQGGEIAEFEKIFHEMTGEKQSGKEYCGNDLHVGKMVRC